MAVFKCKMCGGTIEFEQGATVGTCDSCGTTQTLPRLDDDRRAAMYDRANHFRRNNEFDKASGIYEQILNEDSTDSEAYWSLVLCRYGIEYVEDPATRKMMPTVNRAQYTSIFADEDYKAAVANADTYQKSVYETEAKAIDDIQKGILEISQKEEPFDVFISFKETGADGRRTRDAVLAHELYNELIKEDFKVFFAPVTLESKLGQAYEPYIFAALNSSKVMVVVGTKPEHFNAVWVKNEWSRYLALIKNGAKKTLIPAYKDMDPYDLPEEFSNLLAQDMSKLGFMQDLIRGIKKLAAKDEPKTIEKETVIVNNTASSNVAPLLKRAFMSLEDGEWQKADDFCEQVLNQDPENAQAYLGKLMAELRVRKQEQLANVAEPFDSRNNYSKVLRFGDEQLVSALKGYISHINERNENNRLTGIYNSGVAAMKSATSEAAYKAAAQTFSRISGFKDADQLAKGCLDLAESCRKDAIYDSGRAEMSGDTIAKYEAAIKIFEAIPGWKDTDKQIAACRNKIEEIKAKEEADRIEAERKAEEKRIAAELASKKLKKVISIAAPIAVAVIAFLIVLTKVIIPNSHYKAAVELMNAGNVVDAYESLIALNGYKDSTEKAEEIFVQYKAERIRTAEVGDSVVLGEYEQDNNTSNGKENIEWLILAREDNKVLVISKYALDCQKYNTKYTEVTWETCTLRKWLNETFLTEAFSTEEQAIIQTTTVSADNNPEYSTKPGNATEDKVFLLSINEVNKFFTSDEARKCAPTAYAKAQGAYTSDEYKTASGKATCWWWLRSPGGNQRGAAYVNYDGSVLCLGGRVSSDNDCVRPALWINLDS